MTTPRPAYLRAPNIGLVLLGGGVGAGTREVLTRVISEVDGVQVVVPVVNVLGAFVLGYLYQALASADPGPVTTNRLKLLLGTGFCGGLTTYSSLATDTAVLLDDSRLAMGAAYALGTVLLGAIATVAGIAAGARRHSRHRGSKGASG